MIETISMKEQYSTEIDSIQKQLKDKFNDYHVENQEISKSVSIFI